MDHSIGDGRGRETSFDDALGLKLPLDAGLADKLRASQSQN
jgi:hypothetical protein